MLSYTTRRNLYGNLTKDKSSSNLDFGDTVMNESEKRTCNKRAWDFTQRLHTDVTVAGQADYNLPVNYRRLIGNPTVTIGGIVYTPAEAPSRLEWDRITSVDNTSDIPQYFYIFNNKIEFYPKPSSSSNTITLPYELQAKALTNADYTNGSIVSITNGATTVTATGTTFTAPMAGRYIRITADDATTSGDGEWYRIASVTSGTVLELAIPYEGTTIAAATQPYTIGQMSVLPDGYDMIPVLDAATKYFIANPEGGKAANYKSEYDDLMKELIQDHGQKTSSVVIEQGGGIKNPNLYIRAN